MSDHEFWPCPDILADGTVIDLYDPVYSTPMECVVTQDYHPIYYLKTTGSSGTALYPVLNTAADKFRGFRWRFAAVTEPRLGVATEVAPPGVNCKRCNEYNPHAVPNKPDGKSFVCRACSQGGWSVTWGPRFDV